MIVKATAVDSLVQQPHEATAVLWVQKGDAAVAYRTDRQMLQSLAVNS